MNKKYVESEKYFKVSAQMMPMVTQDPSQIFNTEKNILTYYTHTNLAKATEQANKMYKDSEDGKYLPTHQKQLNLMTANIHLLKEDFK